MTTDAGSFCIKCFADIADPERAGVTADVERIFFSASNTRTFRDGEARAIFRDVWLGHYLETYPHLFFIAFESGVVVGYLAGCDVEPANDPYFAAQVHAAVFHDLWRDFPAHLHINIDGDARSRGVGTRLIDEFVLHCKDTGLPGVHIVTGDGGRNVRFYHRCGFSHEVRRKSQDRSQIFMGRRFG